MSAAISEILTGVVADTLEKLAFLFAVPLEGPVPAEGGEPMIRALIDAIIDNLPSAIIVVGQDRKVLLANKMAAAFARTSKEDLCGRPGGDALSETAPVARGNRRVNAIGEMHKRILVVDDETAVCELMTKAFARVGCAVIAAEYAEEAIAVTKTEMFPVMFIDLNLPGMNGIDLFKAIKALHPSSEAYLITGYASESDLQECRSAGFRDCLMKPISFPVLFQAAQAALKPRNDV